MLPAVKMSRHWKGEIIHSYGMTVFKKLKVQNKINYSQFGFPNVYLTAGKTKTKRLHLKSYSDGISFT